MKMNTAFVVVAVFCFIVSNFLSDACEPPSNDTTLTAEQILIRKFFRETTDPRVRPIPDNGTTILVRLEYVVLSLININQREQQMVLFGWINMRWNNSRVTWNHTEYDVKFLIIESVKIWFPNFAIRNSADKVFGDMFDHEKYKAQVYSTGQVAYSTAGKTTTFCKLDLTYFPFDSQACYLEIFSWTYTVDQLTLSTFGNEIDTSHFNINGQWTLAHSKVKIMSHNISNELYSVVRFMFQFKRKPRYFIIILVIPCTVMSFLVVFVYLLPADSTEKISLSITTLLAYSVFQLTVSDNMPKTSSYIPLITVYISFVLFFSTLSLLSTIFVLMIHHHVLMKTPPRLLLKLVSTGLSKFLGTHIELDHTKRIRKSVLKKRRDKSPMRSPKLKIISSGKLDLNYNDDIDSRSSPFERSAASSRWKNSFSVLTRKIAKIKDEEGIENIFCSDFSTLQSEKGKQQWIEIVSTLDRLFLIIFTFLNLIACLLTFVILPYTAPPLKW